MAMWHLTGKFEPWFIRIVIRRLQLYRHRTSPSSNLKSKFYCLHINQSSIINPLTVRVVGAPQMILQPVFSIFPCSPLPSWTCRTPGLSIPWCCLPTSSFVCLVFFLCSLCLTRWFGPDVMNGRHDHTTAVCVFLRSSGDLHVYLTKQRIDLY